jgi:small GTP-binding protein
MEEKENYSNSNSECEIIYDNVLRSDYRFKIILIGNSGVGKTCIVNKAKKNKFKLDEKSTLGIEFYNINVKIDNKIINLQIWDTCGQEKYHAITKNYYAKTSLAVFIYDITSRKSLINLEEWMDDLKNVISPDIKMYLVGNKNDILERDVKEDDVNKFLKNENFIKKIETSAKEGNSCQELFMDIAKILYEDSKKHSSKEESLSQNKKIVNVEKEKDKEKNSNSNGCFC